MVNFGFPSSGGSQSRVCCRRDFELITTLFTIFRSGPWSHNIYLPGIWYLSDASPKSILMPEPLSQKMMICTLKWLFIGFFNKMYSIKAVILYFEKNFYNWIWQQARLVGFALAFEILEKLYLPSLLLSSILTFLFWSGSCSPSAYVMIFNHCYKCREIECLSHK